LIKRVRNGRVADLRNQCCPEYSQAQTAHVYVDFLLNCLSVPVGLPAALCTNWHCCESFGASIACHLSSLCVSNLTCCCLHCFEPASLQDSCSLSNRGTRCLLVISSPNHRGCSLYLRLWLHTETKLVCCCQVCQPLGVPIEWMRPPPLHRSNYRQPFSKTRQPFVC
jgi:hypothetical protein